MTVYALRLTSGADNAARVRIGDLLGLAPSSNLGARAGIRPGPTAANVSVVAGSMQVKVQPFVAWVDGGISDAQGGYPFVCDAEVTLTLANGHATLARTDVIAAVVRDTAYDGSGLTEAKVEVVQGVAGAGAPALPTNCVPIRNVVVPAGASAGTGGLSSGALSTDRRVYTSGLGGVVFVASETERDALPAMDGTVAYVANIDRLHLRRNGAWVQVETGPSDTIPGAFGAGMTGSVNTYRRGGMGMVAFDLNATNAQAAFAAIAGVTSTAAPVQTINGMASNLTTGQPIAFYIETETGYIKFRGALAAGDNVVGSATIPLTV